MNYEGNTMPEGKLEWLTAQADKYLTEDGDRIWTEYLVQFKERVQKQQQQAELLQEELERSYRMYLNRRQLTMPNAAGVVVPVEKQEVPERNEVTAYQEHYTEYPVEEEEDTSRYVEFRHVEPVTVYNPKTAKNTEFVIGTAILGIVGGAFILTALVMLGMYFMNGFAKGMCLYGGSLLVLLSSELLIYKKWQKLTAILSAIGIGGLYLSTAVNFLVLHNLNMLATVIIILLISVLVLLLSYKRDSFLYRLLGLFSGYLCLLTVGEQITHVEYGVLAGIILGINLLYVMIPMKNRITPFRATHMCLNMFFAYGMDARLEDCGLSDMYRIIMVIGLMMIMQMILVMQMRTEKEDGRMVRVFYGMAIVGISIIIGNVLTEATVTTMLRSCSVGIIGLICFAACLLLRRTTVRWYPYYLLIVSSLFVYLAGDSQQELAICLLVLLVIAKILALWKIPALKWSEAVITTFVCIILLGNAEENTVWFYALLAGILLSICCISQWQTYFEILLIYTLGLCTVAKIDAVVQLPIFAGILFVGILAFNNVKRWKGKYILIYNVAAWAGEGICFLLLLGAEYQESFLTYLCMLVFGLSTVVLTFREEYGLTLRRKNLLTALFLTYMVFVLPEASPIVKSILLMIIALSCVGMGFGIKEKAIRIYGLVLSLLVCGKIVLYDYIAALLLQKTILFFVVGVIALIISAIYIILEKKSNVTEEAEREVSYETQLHENCNSQPGDNVTADGVRQ